MGHGEKQSLLLYRGSLKRGRERGSDTSDSSRSAVPTSEVDSFMSAVSQLYALSEDEISRLFLGKKKGKKEESVDTALTPALYQRIIEAKENLIVSLIKTSSENKLKNSENARNARLYLIIDVYVLFILAVIVMTIFLNKDVAVLLLSNGGVAAAYIGFLIVALRQQTMWHRLDINAQLSQLMLAVITTIDDPKHAAALASVFRDQLNGNFRDIDTENPIGSPRRTRPKLPRS